MASDRARTNPESVEELDIAQIRAMLETMPYLKIKVQLD